MTSHVLPPFDYSGPLSKRAVQLLRELQGLRVLDDVVPTLSETVSLGEHRPKVEAPPSAQVNPTNQAAQNIVNDIEKVVVKKRSRWSKLPFSREAYLNDVRGSAMGHMLLAVLLAMGILLAMGGVTQAYMLPQLQTLQENERSIANLPAELTSVTSQLMAQKNKREAVNLQSAKLMSGFSTTNEVTVSYVNFLHLLEGAKVNVTKQTSSVTQSATNPFNIVTSVVQSVKKDLSKPVVNAAQTGDSILMSLKGDIKPGLNYYHFGISLQGSYVGYLVARQALVNANPNLVVHSEDIRASSSNDGQMEILAYISLPFLNQP